MTLSAFKGPCPTCGHSNDFLSDLAANQEPLGEPFATVLFENLDELYETSETVGVADVMHAYDQPLYTEAQLQAAVAAARQEERERLAKIADAQEAKWISLTAEYIRQIGDE